MDLEALTTYFQEQVGIKFFVGPDVRDMPDVIGIITQQPSQGYANEGLFESSQFQVQVRGSQNRLDDAKAHAEQIDKMIEFGDYPHGLWGSWVITAYRAGGGPAPSTLDNGRRVVFSCSYVAQEATDL